MSAEPFLVSEALAAAARKLRPRFILLRPALLATEVAALFFAYDAFTRAGSRPFSVPAASLLAAVVLLTCLAEAFAEARALSRARGFLAAGRGQRTRQAFGDGTVEEADAEHLRAGDVVLVSAGETVPVDGVVIEGAATVDESALTGESAPVLREAKPGRSAVIGGARVLSDRLKIRVSVEPGEGLLPRLAQRIQEAARPRDLRGLVFAALAVAPALLTAWGVVPWGPLAAEGNWPLAWRLVAALAASLLPVVLLAVRRVAGFSGVERLMRRGLVPTTSAAPEVAGRVDVLLVDDASALASSRRRAFEFLPAPGVPKRMLADAAQLASLVDETAEGRSIVALAKDEGLGGRKLEDLGGADFVPLSPQTRVSGLNAGELVYRKGPASVIREATGPFPPEMIADIERIAAQGGEAIAVAVSRRALGVVHMRDVVAGGFAARLAVLRAAGVRVVLGARGGRAAAEAVARDVGADDVVVLSGPADKEGFIREQQEAGRRVAANGGAADAAALSLAALGIAGEARAPEAEKAAGLLDVDSDPAKVIDAAEIGRETRRARSNLTAFVLGGDAAKGVAVVAAAAAGFSPAAARLDVLRLHSPASAVLSAALVNAAALAVLAAAASRGRRGAGAAPRRELVPWFLAGALAACVALKLADAAFAALGLV